MNGFHVIVFVGLSIFSAETDFVAVTTKSASSPHHSKLIKSQLYFTIFLTGSTWEDEGGLISDSGYKCL